MEINGINFTIGADPEVFVSEGGKFVSAHKLVPGTKEEPFNVRRGAVQVDGMALEFNIDPADNCGQFLENLDTVQTQLKGMIGDKEFIYSPTVQFNKKFMKKQPIEALILGCDPDYNAYTMAANEKPRMGSLMRTAGGHLHVGGINTPEPMSEEHFSFSARLARAMDKYLGVYSVLWDKDDVRRGMYGGAGAFRPKSYGMEYRTLSNYWIFSPKISEFVYERTLEAVESLFGEDDLDPVYREIINNSDRNNSFFNGNKTANNLLNLLVV